MNPTLRKAHKLLRKITKKLGNESLYFSAQLGVDSSKESDIVTYAAMIEAPSEGLEPIYFAALDKNEFIGKIDNFLKEKAGVKELKKAFHDAQLQSIKKSVEYHKEQLLDIAKEDEVTISKLKEDIQEIKSEIEPIEDKQFDELLKLADELQKKEEK